eukprot:905087_1
MASAMTGMVTSMKNDSTTNNIKQIGPRYTRIKVTEDQDQLDQALIEFDKKLSDNATILRETEDALNTDWFELEQNETRNIVNSIYNQFTHLLFESLLNHNCIQFTKTFLINQSKNITNIELQKILMQYENTMEAIQRLEPTISIKLDLSDPTETNIQLKRLYDELDMIEKDLIETTDHIKKEAHQRFLNTANDLRRDNDERALFRFLDNYNSNTDAVIEYDNKTLLNDTDIMMNAMKYFKELF